MILDDLIDLGLTKYESLAIITLVSHGKNHARAISEISQIPFGRVYDVLSNLENLGLVEKEDTRPKNFSAVNPQLIISRLMNKKETELERIRQKSQEVSQKLLQLHRELPQESNYWNVSIGDAALSYYNDKILDATDSIKIFIELHTIDPIDFLTHTKTLFSRLNILRNHKIPIQIIISIKSEEEIQNLYTLFSPHLQEIVLNEIRFTFEYLVSFVVIDEEKTLLKMHNPVDSDNYIATIFLWQSLLAQDLSRKFNDLWKKGIIIDQSKYFN